MNSYNNAENPEFLNEYLVHIKVVRMLSERTVQEYYLDTRLFLKYICNTYHDGGESVDDTDISSMTDDDLKRITVSDIIPPMNDIMKLAQDTESFHHFTAFLSI